MLPEIETVDQAALDRFILDLIEADFEPGEYGGRPAWRGPIDPALADLTDAKEMVIWLEDGWPYVQPHVMVKGLRPSVHLQGDLLCLWPRADESMGWMRLGDLRERLREWAERYRGAATSDDPNLDPNAYWPYPDPKVLATVDLTGVPWGDGGSGYLRGELDANGLVLRIGENGPLRVRWYGRAALRQLPVNLDMLTNALQKDQATNLRRELERVGEEGGTDILMLIWGTPVGEPNILVLRLGRDTSSGTVTSAACEVARTDERILLLRAGPDAPFLRPKAVTLFGAGAIGSQLASLLARSGVGRLRVTDVQRLRPGDVVRHAGTHGYVGYPKSFVTRIVAREYAPWTDVDVEFESPWSPARIRELCDRADLVIDATGSVTFPDQLSRLLADTGTPMLSIALYRGGDIARARLMPPGGPAIHERSAPTYRTIPPGPGELAPVWETGCAAPVNNAPPAAVGSAAGLAARWAVEILTGRQAEAADIVEVYRPVEAPFDGIGTYRFGP